ncbi:MAG: IPT/TIG domain-containing protein, partial [Coriobacteriia bacterium]
MRVLRGVIVTALVLAFALGAPQSADAVLVPMTVDELAHAADTIVVVNIASARTHNRGNSTARPDIATDYRLQVSRVLKGARPSEFLLTQPHGTVGDITLVVQDLPAFTPGEQAVLFLDEESRVIGGWQGKLAIERGVISSLGIRIDELARRIDSGQSLSAATIDVAIVDMLSLATSAVLSPAITGVSPAGANAGIGETVTITGRDFGTVAGTVHFQRGDSLDVAEVVEAGVVSWTDTRIVVTVPQKAALFVRVTTSSGAASADFAYRTGFSASGRRWLRIPVGYRINENAASMVGEGAAIQRALSTWANAGSEFGLVYGGSTTKTGFALDGENTVSFAPLVGGSLGMNSYWIRGSEIIESDIVFNSVDYQWADYGTSRVIDVET